MKERKQKPIKPTVSNLSKKYGVSRSAIYNHINKKGFVIKNSKLTKEIVKELENHYGGLLEKRKVEKEKIDKANKEAKKNPNISFENISDDKISTAVHRLSNLKQEYNFNKGLITELQNEIDTFKKKNGSTTTVQHNQVQQVIPQISALEKYIKLNLNVNKSIQELEEFLKVGNEKEENPF